MKTGFHKVRVVTLNCGMLQSEQNSISNDKDNTSHEHSVNTEIYQTENTQNEQNSDYINSEQEISELNLIMKIMRLFSPSL